MNTTNRVTADQMRDAITNVQRAMNSIKSCVKGDNMIAEKRFLTNDLDVLAGMALARKNHDLSERQASWLAAGRELLATSSDEGQVGQAPSQESLDLLRNLARKFS
jgi:hypothetical protein